MKTQKVEFNNSMTSAAVTIRRIELAAILGALYIAYVLIFPVWPEMLTLPADLIEMHFVVLLKLIALLSPVCIAIMMVHADKFSNEDLGLMFFPPVFWLVATLVITGGKSATNFCVVEPNMVFVLSGLYLLKLPLQKLGLSEKAMRYGYVAVSMLAVMWFVMFFPAFEGE